MSAFAVPRWSAPSPLLEAELATLAPVSAALLASRNLLSRTDSKFLLDHDSLVPLLRELRNDYGAVLAGDTRLARYDTLYFDTPQFGCAVDHGRGRLPRFKVRVRQHVEREVSALEVKTKTPRGSTDKRRRDKPFGDTELSPADLAWVNAQLPHRQDVLVPAALTAFRRITLVGLTTMERVTIDLSLHLELEGKVVDLDRVVIVEVKQPRYAARSPVMLALRGHHASRRSFSKYVTAVMLLNPGVRRNRFLPLLRRLERTEGWSS